jgi:hypothetical protein
LISVVSIIILLLVAWLGRRARWDSRLLLGIASACLLSYHVFLHDLSLLIIPIVVTCDRALAQGKYLNLGVLGVVLAFPTLLAMAGLPLWANSLASLVMLVQITVLEKELDFGPAKQGVLVGASR